jgi:hypothetical protein
MSPYQTELTVHITLSIFQEHFATKEVLLAKFGQLAELRNTIRHSRTADEITRKEGEAAILWFGAILEKEAVTI